jgi:kelch-like protein 10
MDPKYVLENVTDHPYVTGNDECHAIVQDAHTYLLISKLITQKEGKILNREFARPRIPHDILFAIGGCTSYSVSNCIQVYNTRANRWVRVEEIESNFQRACHGMAVIGFNIYVIGGCDKKGVRMV